MMVFYILRTSIISESLSKDLQKTWDFPSPRKIILVNDLVALFGKLMELIYGHIAGHILPQKNLACSLMKGL